MPIWVRVILTPVALFVTGLGSLFFYGGVSRFLTLPADPLWYPLSYWYWDAWFCTLAGILFLGCAVFYWGLVTNKLFKD